MHTDRAPRLRSVCVAVFAALCLLGAGLAGSAARTSSAGLDAGGHSSPRIAAVQAALHADSHLAIRGASPTAASHTGFPAGLASADLAAGVVLLALAVWLLLRRRSRQRRPVHVPYGYGPPRAPPRVA